MAWNQNKTVSLSPTKTDSSYSYWLNKHLEFMTGQYQRIFGAKGRTTIEQIFALFAIALDQIDVSGLQQYSGKDPKNNLKNKVKKSLEQRKALEFVPAERSITNMDVFLVNNNLKEDQIQQELYNVFEEQYVKIAENDTDDILESTLQGLFDETSHSHFLKVSTIKKRLNVKRLDSVFMTVNYKYPKNKTGAINTICSWLQLYFKKVRAVALSDQEKMAWESFCRDAQGERYIDDKMRELVISFFQYTDTIQQALGIQNKQGFLGELSAYGRLLFNIKESIQTARKKKNRAEIDFYGTGNWLNDRSKMLGTDLIITVRDKKGHIENFGIQVKNPFQLTTKDTLETYKESYSLSPDKVQPLYDNILKIGQDQYAIDLFEMMNINLTNTTVTKQQVLSTIESFLGYYSAEFGRLDEESIEQTDWAEEAEDFTAKIDTKIQNLFFVVKGELVQSSRLVEGLRQQYKLLSEGYKAEARKKEVVHINYSNNISPNHYEKVSNRLPERFLTRTWEKEKGQGGRGAIKEGESARNLLSQVSFNTSLKIKVPSIKEILRKKR